MLHELAERSVHHAVARHGRLAGKGARHDGQAPVRAAAFAVAGMAAVALALVLELEALGMERGEALADARGNAQALSSGR